MELRQVTDKAQIFSRPTAPIDIEMPQPYRFPSQTIEKIVPGRTVIGTAVQPYRRNEDMETLQKLDIDGTDLVEPYEVVLRVAEGERESGFGVKNR